MVGQKFLLETLEHLYNNDSLPRFIILVGDFGSEINLVAKELARRVSILYAEATDCKIDTVRDIISNAYSVTSQTIFCINDIDNMSVNAENALLKVTEEPPNNARFVLTVHNLNSVLLTLQSRSTIYIGNSYSQDELLQYCRYKNYKDEKLLVDICNTPGEIDLVNSYGATEFISFVTKVTENVATVSGANAFKIAKSIKFKDSEDGYDLALFLRTFYKVCNENSWYLGGVCTCKHLGDLTISQVNKQMLFDRWLLAIREEWRNGNC